MSTAIGLLVGQMYRYELVCAADVLTSHGETTFYKHEHEQAKTAIDALWLTGQLDSIDAAALRNEIRFIAWRSDERMREAFFRAIAEDERTKWSSAEVQP